MKLLVFTASHIPLDLSLLSRVRGGSRKQEHLKLPLFLPEVQEFFMNEFFLMCHLYLINFQSQPRNDCLWLFCPVKHYFWMRWFASVFTLSWGFPGDSGSEESACSVGDPGLNPGLGRSPGEGQGNPLQYSCLENPMDRGAWWATVHVVTKSWTRLND